MYLRQNYHFGPVKIQMYLKRYHDVEIGHSGIYNILRRLGLNRLPASQRYQRREKRYKRYEKQLPGNRVHSVRSRRRCLAVGRGQPLWFRAAAGVPVVAGAG